VSVRAKKLETQFANILGLIEPEARLLASLPTIAARSWDTRKERIAADARSLRRLLDSQTLLNEGTIKARLQGEPDEADFKVMKASIAQETARIQEQMAALDAEASSMQALMSQTDAEIINFQRSWENAAMARKKEIQNALFSDGLAFSPKSLYFCPSNSLLVQLLEDILGSMGLVGVPGGI
jgi:hypothetical protein